MGPSGRQFAINDETSEELTHCGIQLEDGILDSSCTYTIKPAVRLFDGKRVAVKLYNETTQAKHNIPTLPTKPRVRSSRLDDVTAEYFREMNIMVSPRGEPASQRSLCSFLFCHSICTYRLFGTCATLREGKRGEEEEEEALAFLLPDMTDERWEIKQKKARHGARVLQTLILFVYGI